MLIYHLLKNLHRDAIELDTTHKIDTTLFFYRIKFCLVLKLGPSKVEFLRTSDKT